MSRTDLFLTLYLLVAVGAVLAVIGTCLLTETDSGTDGHLCSRCCHCVGLVFRGTGSWILTWMAALFLLLAALLMPSAIVLSDTCGGIETVLVQVTELLACTDGHSQRETHRKLLTAPCPVQFFAQDTDLGLNYASILVKDTDELSAYVDQIPFGNFSQDFAYPLQPIVIQGAGPFLQVHHTVDTIKMHMWRF